LNNFIIIGYHLINICFNESTATINLRCSDNCVVKHTLDHRILHVIHRSILFVNNWVIIGVDEIIFLIKTSLILHENDEIERFLADKVLMFMKAAPDWFIF